MESIKDLLAENPSGITKMKESLSFKEYRNNYGFDLKNIWTIFESKDYHHSGKDWFQFPGKTLETLFSVKEKSEGNLLVVYIVETIKNGKVHCDLVLSDEGFRKLMETSKILKVHQMYTKFWRDHLAMNRN